MAYWSCTHARQSAYSRPFSTTGLIAQENVLLFNMFDPNVRCVQLSMGINELNLSLFFLRRRVAPTKPKILEKTLKKTQRHKETKAAADPLKEAITALGAEETMRTMRCLKESMMTVKWSHRVVIRMCVSESVSFAVNPSGPGVRTSKRRREIYQRSPNPKSTV